MKKSNLILLLAVLLSSCVTDRAYNRICKACAPVTELKNDSSDTKATLSVRDTSAHIEGKDGPEINLVFGEDCDSIKKAFAYLKEHPLIKTVNGINTTVGFSNGKLNIKTSTNPYEILFKGVLRELYVYKNAFHESVKREVQVCELDHRNWIDKLGRWMLLIDLIVLIIIGFYVYFRLRKG